MNSPAQSMENLNTQPITGWLQAARLGDQAAISELFDAVYPVLHQMASNRPGVVKDSALTPTAVIHELFLKINDSVVFDAENRHHFYATCARAMRFIVADFARSAQSLKRGGQVFHCALTTAMVAQPDRTQELLDLHAALDELNLVDSRLRELVELKFFGGLTYSEIADLHALSERTVKRDWARARAFLAARSQ